jgi:hypothetical protein
VLSLDDMALVDDGDFVGLADGIEALGDDGFVLH